MPEELTNAEQSQLASAVPQELPKAKKIFEKQPGSDQGKEELVTDVLASLPRADGGSLSDGSSALASVALSKQYHPA